MIAKFHSAPGHSMETTLTINIPPPERIRAAKGEKLREKPKDKGETLQGPSARIKDWEKEDENAMGEKEEERMKRDDREREREKLERERRALAERGTSYKDKFQKIREKYDRVKSTHETHLQELDILNTKIKKLQAENDLLLDAVFLADTPLYDRYFPSGPGFGPPPIGHPGPLYHSSKPGQGHAIYAQHPNEPPLGGPLQSFPSRVSDNPAASSSGYSTKLGHHYPHQSQDPHTFYPYPSREPMHPDSIPPPIHHRQLHRSTYRPYVPPSNHHGMPPPPPPISGGENDREKQREHEWERDRARREWEWEREREGRHPAGLPPTPPLVPAIGLPPSNGYNPMTTNGHGYGHGFESLPPTRTDTRQDSRASLSHSSRSASRRRNEGMKIEMDVDADVPRRAHSPEVAKSLGGPVQLDVDLEVAKERGRLNEPVGRDGGRSRRGSLSQKPPIRPPMGMLEPGQPLPRYDERKQRGPHQERDREGYGYDRGHSGRETGHATTHRASNEDQLNFPPWWTDDEDSDEMGLGNHYLYEQRRRHDRDGRWDGPGEPMENSGAGMNHGLERAREEEEEEEEEEADRSEKKGSKGEAMDVDEPN